MTGSVESKLRAAQQLPYLPVIREQLKETNTKVRKWIDWDPELCVYEAFYDTRHVIIPIPTCAWSLLVGLHEIGHISTGERMHSYLAEYNAEMWAINRAGQRYSIYCSEYEQDAKRYVLRHMIEDMLHYGLKDAQLKKHVLDWLEITPREVVNRVQEIAETQIVITP